MHYNKWVTVIWSRK